MKKAIKVFSSLVLFFNDLFFLALSCFLAYYLRFFTKIFGEAKPTYAINDKYVYYSVIFIAVAIIIFLLFKLYFWNSIYKGPIFYFRSISPPIISAVLVVVFGHYYKGFSFSKIWFALLLFTGAFFIIISRFLIGLIIKKIISKSGTGEIFVATISENISNLRELPRAKKKIIFGSLLLGSDMIFLGIAFYISYFLRFNTGILAEVNTTYLIEKNYIFYSIIFILSAAFIFLLYGLYDRDKIYRGSGYYSKLLKGISINIVVIILTGYIFNLFTFSRKWILLLYFISIVLIFISRFFIEAISQKIATKIGIKSYTLIIGIGENAKRIEDSLKKYSHEVDTIMGHVDKKQRILKGDEYTRNLTILGYLENLREIIYANNIQRVIISSPEFKYFEILEILEGLKTLDVTVLLFPGFFEFSLRRLSVREIGGVPLMQVSNIGFYGVNLFLKNLTDYVLGIIIFIIFIPIYLFVGLLIKIDSRGPVFFKQKRMTKDCRIFYMYKFRTMYVDAEKRLKDLVKYNEADGPLFKMKNDPRITRVGRFLRRFSIDELPQIINVLKGELSLVGPRPPIPSEVEKYDEWEMKRMNVKQGITGLWQISGRSELSFEEMARLDLYYIQNWSIEMDLKIILKTIPAVLFGKGAY